MGLNPFLATGYILTGVGFLIEAAKSRAPAGNGAPAPAPALGRAPTRRGVGQDPHRFGEGAVRGVSVRRIRSIEDRVGWLRREIIRGGDPATSPNVVAAARGIVRELCADGRGGAAYCTKEKDWWGEYVALFDAVSDPAHPFGFRYVRDPTPPSEAAARAAGLKTVSSDLFATAEALLRIKAGDCFPSGTLLLRDDYALVPIEDIRAGDRIWGRDAWTRVLHTWDKGVLPTWQVVLNNGSVQRLTPDHKVYVAFCDRHGKKGPLHANGVVRCSCSVASRRIERVHVSDLREGDVLVQPEGIPFGSGTPDLGRTYVEGLYISDGWHEPRRFAISGQDGCPKEAQKREVEAICRTLGIPTKWQRKYIRVLDREWASQLALLGTHAPEKHVATLDLAEAPARELLRGILADSGANTASPEGRTFTTTSHELFVQTRVLARMAGIVCGSSFIVDHGGFGRNPIWRLCLRGRRRDGRAAKLLRVKSVERLPVDLPCRDIATEDHYVWLPEADWTVSNCDEGSVLLGSMILAIGGQVKLRVIQAKGASTWSHVYLLVGLPPGAPTRWVPLDWSVRKPAGWEVEGAEQCRRTGKPAGMVVKVRDFDVL